MNILLLGKSGMLGSYFLKLLAGNSDFEIFAYDYEHLDITNNAELAEVFSAVHPFFVINCAAYTEVDACEKNVDLAFSVNGYAVGEIAKLCEIHDSILIHFSTDYVFDGQKKTGYTESDITSPINLYGESKLEGENAIMENTEKYYLIRTSWLYGLGGKNFVDTMLELGKKGEVNVVNDQFGCPTYAKDLADAVLTNLVEPYLKEPDEHEHWLSKGKIISDARCPFGIYHLTNSGSCSWYEFAKEIFKLAGKDVKVNPVSSEEFPRPAQRPHYSILLNKKIEPLRDWKNGLKHYLELIS